MNDYLFLQQLFLELVQPLLCCWKCVVTGFVAFLESGKRLLWWLEFTNKVLLEDQESEPAVVSLDHGCVQKWCVVEVLAVISGSDDQTLVYNQKLS
jgi:hypothetical protein